MSYVDTNVILAKYTPKDKLSNRATAFLEEGRSRKIISPVSVVELAAIISRLETDIQAPEELLREPPRRRIRAFVDFMVKDCGLFVASVPTQVRIKIAGSVLSVPIEYQSCLLWAYALKLKTLDLAHLAYADVLRKWGHDIDTFVTFDGDILEKSSQIKTELDIEVKEP
jgi:predicted nucleic acid-binding protein